MATYYEQQSEIIKRNIELAKQGRFGDKSAEILAKNQEKLNKLSGSNASIASSQTA